MAPQNLWKEVRKGKWQEERGRGKLTPLGYRAVIFFYMISFSDGYPYPTDEELRPGKFEELLDVYPGSK